MENKLDELKDTLEKTGGKLDDIVLKLDGFGGHVTGAIGDENHCEDVESLLETVKQVQTDYQMISKDISEVKEIQRQVHSAIQMNAYDLQKRFEALRMRMLAHRIYPNRSDISSNP